MNTTEPPWHVCPSCGTSYRNVLSPASHVKVMHSRRTATKRRRLQAPDNCAEGSLAVAGGADQALTQRQREFDAPFDADTPGGADGAAGCLPKDSEPVAMGAHASLNDAPGSSEDAGKETDAAANESEPYGDLARRVQVYFRHHTDVAPPLYKLSTAEVARHRSILSRLSRSETQLLDRCRRKGVSAAEAQDELLYFRDVRRTAVAEAKEPGRFVSKEDCKASDTDFTTGLHSGVGAFGTLSGEGFGRFVLQDRKVYAVEKNWKRCDIALSDLKSLFPQLNHLIVHAGAFRPAIDVVLEVIESAGGFSEISGFEAQSVPCSAGGCDCMDDTSGSIKKGLHQVRSSWRNGAAFEEMTQNVPRDSSGNPRGKLVPVSVYEDGIATADSGACSISVLRLWVVCNTDPRACKWVTVGVFPQEEDPTKAIPKDHVARARREVYQRYLFMVIKELAEASRSGRAIPGGIIYPRIYNIPVDQPACMSLLSHKRTNCDRECGQCDLRTRDEPDNVKAFTTTKANVQKVKNSLVALQSGLAKDKAFAKACKANERKSKLNTIRVIRKSTSPRIAPSLRPTESDILVVRAAEEAATTDATKAEEIVQSALDLVEAERERLQAVQNEAKAAALVRSTGHAEMLKSKGTPMDYQRATHLQLQVSEIEMKLAAAAQHNVDDDKGEFCEQDAGQKALMQRILKPLREELTSMSLNTSPSALAAVDGMVTRENRMSRISGYDNLHVSAEGTDRDFCDGISQVEADPEWSLGEVSKIATIRAINQALAQLPGPASLPGNARIRETATELQSGQTATLRRKLMAVIPVVLLGLRPQTEPDNDLLVQVGFRIADNDREMRSVNKPPSHCLRTEKQITCLQANYLKMARDMVVLLNVRPKSKLHNVAFHIRGSLEQFGTFRDTDTNENERQNKDPRRTWRITSKRKADLAATVMSIMLSKERQSVEEKEQVDAVARASTDESVALSTRYKTTVPRRLLETGRLSANLLSQQESIICEIRQCLSTAESIEEGLSHSLEDCPRTESPTNKPWVQLKRMSQLVVAARFEWAPATPVSQTLHLKPFNDRRGLTQRPGIAYNPQQSSVVESCAASPENVHTRCGLLAAVLRSRSDHGPAIERCHDVTVIMRLEVAEPAPGNVKMVREFGHRRFRHARSPSGELIVDVMSAQVVVRELALVPDLHYARKQWGRDFTVAQGLRSVVAMRSDMHYFDVRTVQFTSAPTRTLLCGSRDPRSNDTQLVTEQDAPDDEHGDVPDLLT